MLGNPADDIIARCYRIHKNICYTGPVKDTNIKEASTLLWITLESRVLSQNEVFALCVFDVFLLLVLNTEVILSLKLGFSCLNTYSACL